MPVRPVRTKIQANDARKQYRQRSRCKPTIRLPTLVVSLLRPAIRSCPRPSRLIASDRLRRPPVVRLPVSSGFIVLISRRPDDGLEFLVFVMRWGFPRPVAIISRFAPLHMKPQDQNEPRMIAHALTASSLRFDMARYGAKPVVRSQHRAGTASFEKRDPARPATTGLVGWNASAAGKDRVQWYPAESHS